MSSKTYYLQPDKKFVKQGYQMFDENKEVVYEAKVIKQTFFAATPYEFINHITQKTENHKIGHTVTTEQSGGMFSMMTTKSYFKFDGKKIWDYLHEIGIRIDSHPSGKKLGMIYNITLKGKEMATIETTAGNGSKSIITNGVCYEVKTDDENIDLAFLIAFAFAKTDQIFYS